MRYSVLIPLYGTSRELLERALSSVLSAQRPDVEIVLVEAMYKGKSVFESTKYANHNQIIYILADRASVPYQRNLSLENAAGDYLVFCDADDYLHPDFFTIADQTIRDFPAADIIVFNDTCGPFQPIVYNRRDFLETTEPTTIRRWFNSAEKQRPRFFEKSLWAKIYKRATLVKAKARFDLSLQSTQDHFFNLRIIRDIFSVVCAQNYMLYHYELSPHSMTKSTIVSSPVRFDTLLAAWKKLFTDYPPSEEDKLNWAYNLGLVYLPTMLRHYFCNKDTGLRKAEAKKWWKKIAKSHDYAEAILLLHYSNCTSLSKKAYLACMKARLYGLLFWLYFISERIYRRR